MDSLIQVLDGLNGEDPKTLSEERLVIGETFGTSKSDPFGIRAMQKFLGVTADGIIGPITRSAIVNWKMQNTLYGNGIWDQEARTKYLSGNAVSVPPPTTVIKPGDPVKVPSPDTLYTPPSIKPTPGSTLSVVANATNFLDRIKGNTPTIVLVAGGLALVGAAIWYASRPKVA